jgi:Holliday junction resolvase RusA-like endonuclease
MVLDVFVPGRPKTKGSMRVVNGRTGAMSDTPASHRWRQQMAYVIKGHYRQAGGIVPAPIEGACVVGMIFYLPIEDVTREGSGDIDKLARNVLDALGTSDPDDARVYVTDAQVIRMAAEKRPATSLHASGLQLRVWA